MRLEVCEILVTKNHLHKHPLEVIYKSQTFTSSPGSSVKLFCQVYYDPKQCDGVHAVWSHLEPAFELTDPEKYLTIVNETVLEDNRRHRQVLTEILDLTLKDEGLYQCQATGECRRAQTVMGRLMIVFVK
ncbi:hypothetical protein WMY93_026584 [Mugilogobius chulae]|uniref:Ig-like domain-containing protein n=1 Tax=Mugilogobius chulae TaxID=88201 RepID=A0AAW0N7Y4_9GOBI